MASKFRSPAIALPELPSAEEVARFAAAAGTHNVEPSLVLAMPAAMPAVAPAPVIAPAHRDRSAPPWAKHDRDAKPHTGVNLRLNEHEHELLKYLAEAEERSMHQVIKRILMPAVIAAAEAMHRARKRSGSV